MNHEAEVGAGEITVEELELEIERCFYLRDKHTQIKAEASAVWEQYELIQNKVRGMLESLNKTSYKAEAGTFSFSLTDSYKTPKTLEQKELFFNYLKEKGIFDEMVTINSRTLNSYAATECEVQYDQGNFDFTIPGLEKGEPAYKVSLKKNK